MTCTLVVLAGTRFWPVTVIVSPGTPTKELIPKTSPEGVYVHTFDKCRYAPEVNVMFILVGKVVTLTEVVEFVEVALVEVLSIAVAFMEMVSLEVVLVNVMLFEALGKLLKYPTRAMIMVFDTTVKLLRTGVLPKKMLDTAVPLGRKPAPLIET